MYIKKFRKKGNKDKKKISAKIQYGYPKTHNFMLISNTLKQFIKNVPKKVISKNVAEIYALFPLLLMFVLLITIFCVQFLHFFNEFEIGMKFCDFDTFFDKKNLCHIRTFSNLKPNAQLTATKIKKSKVNVS
jgi:hypothetical protein